MNYDKELHRNYFINFIINFFLLILNVVNKIQKSYFFYLIFFNIQFLEEKKHASIQAVFSAVIVEFKNVEILVK